MILLAIHADFINTGVSKLRAKVLRTRPLKLLFPRRSVCLVPMWMEGGETEHSIKELLTQAFYSPLYINCHMS